MGSGEGTWVGKSDGEGVGGKLGDCDGPEVGTRVGASGGVRAREEAREKGQGEAWNESWDHQRAGSAGMRWSKSRVTEAATDRAQTCPMTAMWTGCCRGVG